VILEKEVCSNCDEFDPPWVLLDGVKVTLCCIEEHGYFKIPQGIWGRYGYGSNGRVTSVRLPISDRTWRALGGK